MRLEDWTKVIEANLTGASLCAQAAGEVMLCQGKGKIINIASVAGLRGVPPQLLAIGYHTSQGGVIDFTKVSACRWADHNIQVKCYCPGMVPDPDVQPNPGASQGSFSVSYPAPALGQRT
jgi:gluconate 5-dehydrogenase